MITDVAGEELRTEVGETHNLSLIAALQPGVQAEMRELLSSVKINQKPLQNDAIKLKN
jgi:hypothetical protein